MNAPATTPVYEPDDDSYLLLATMQEELQNLAAQGKTLVHLHLLDMGAGNGFLGFEAMKKGFRTTFVDSNPLATKTIQSILDAEDLTAQVITSDLFTLVPAKLYDVIVFNTPYLPADEELFDPALHGGVIGNETTLRFLHQATDYLAPQGFILLLTSTLADPETIVSTATSLGFTCNKIASEKLFFEELIIYKLTLLIKGDKQ